MMQYELDSKKLATMVRQQRSNRTLREVSRELRDVSASTLHRLEVGKCPDMGVFLRVCRWLKVEPAQFFQLVPEPQAIPSAPDPSPEPIAYSHGQIVNLIRTDTTLEPVVANVLIALVSGAYQVNQ